MSNHFTPEYITSRKWSAFDNAKSIYHPELELSRYHDKNVPIKELRMGGYDYGVKAEPSNQGGPVISDKRTGYDLDGTMRNDQYSKRPTHVKNNINDYRPLTSSRM